MIVRPKNTRKPLTRIGAKDLNRPARLISHLAWLTIMITAVTALTLWLVGAPVLVILLMAPLVLVGTVTLMATKNLSNGLHYVYLNIQRLEVDNQTLEEIRLEQERSAAAKAFEFEHRSRLLKVLADVMISINSRIFNSIKDIDQVLQEIAGLISERLGFLGVYIFVIETDLGQEIYTTGDGSSGEQLILRAANTQGGRQLIENGYSLTLNQDNIVSTAARIRTPIFGSNGHSSPPDLETIDPMIDHSEVGLPLLVGEKLLGVLYLQGSVASLLTREELDLLQTLAHQLSITIDNTSMLFLTYMNQQSLEQEAGNLGQKSRQNLLRNQPERGYCTDSSGEPVFVNDTWHPVMIEAKESGQIAFGNPVADAYTLAVPVKIRDQVAGVVRLRKPLDGGEWRPEEVSLVERLSDRLSAALESARLFEETRRAAEREHLTSEITTRMRSTNDPQAVLQIAARELRKALQADKARLLVQTAVVRPSITNDACPVDQSGDQI